MATESAPRLYHSVALGTVTIPDGMVNEADGCPGCDNRRNEWLIWDDLDYITCAVCGTRYDPAEEV